MTSSTPVVTPEELMPDVHQLDARHQVLWVLIASRANAEEWRTAAEVSKMLSDQYGIAIPRQKVVAILNNERALGSVVMVRRNGHGHFKVMRRGEDEILRTSAKPIFIEPSKALTSIRAVEDILRSLSGDVRICDTYIDTRTLDYVAKIEEATRIRLLTENIQNSSRFKRDLAALESERTIPIETRVCVPGQLHDRYVLHADGMLLVGASLKDIGKKQSMIIALSNSFVQELERGFERRWNIAARFG